MQTSSSIALSKTRRKNFTIHSRLLLIIIIAEAVVWQLFASLKLHVEKAVSFLSQPPRPVTNVSNNSNSSLLSVEVKSSLGVQGATESHRVKKKKCALNFYGLPRSFKTIVLPTIIENIIKVNAPYGCDVFANYHALEFEGEGRSGAGGKVNLHEILELRSAVQNLLPAAVVVISHFTEEDFQRDRAEAINKTHTVKDVKGHPIYFPWKPLFTGYQFPDTMDNILRMWHSQVR